MLQVTETQDARAVTTVHVPAFGDEGAVVAGLACELLLDPSAQPLVSLLAVENQCPVGHVLLSRASLAQDSRHLRVSLLAPLGVVPAAQRRGIGARLIHDGVERLRALRVDLVFVLGHPGYYGRHGFRAARARGYETPHPQLPEHADAWQVRELRSGALSEGRGVVRAACALDRAEYWY